MGTLAFSDLQADECQFPRLRLVWDADAAEQSPVEELGGIDREGPIPGSAIEGPYEPEQFVARMEELNKIQTRMSEKLFFALRHHLALVPGVDPVEAQTAMFVCSQWHRQRYQATLHWLSTHRPDLVPRFTDAIGMLQRNLVRCHDLFGHMAASMKRQPKIVAPTEDDKKYLNASDYEDLAAGRISSVGLVLLAHMRRIDASGAGRVAHNDFLAEIEDIKDNE